MGDRVFKFAPAAPDRRSHRYNPLDVVAAAPERRRHGAALRVANALLLPERGHESWIGGCREIFAAAVMTALEHGQGTIGAVYDLLSMPAPRASDLFAALGSATKSGEARSVYARYAAMDPKVVTSYLSILFDAGLRLWADADVRDATAASDFDVAAFRADPASVYLVVSQADIDRLAPLLRLMFQQMFTVLQETERGPKDSFDVLFLLDEFASLGRMDELGRAITTVRSSGAHLMLIVQSLANLFGPYGRDGARNFMGNCELQLFMAPTDMETPRYISEAIGDVTRVKRTRTWRGTGFEPPSVCEKEEGAPLIRPEQVRLLGPETVLALIRDQPPVRARRVTWFRDRGLRKLHARQARIGFEAFEPPEMPRTPRAGETWREIAERLAKPSGGGAAAAIPGEVAEGGGDDPRDVTPGIGDPLSRDAGAKDGTPESAEHRELPRRPEAAGAREHGRATTMKGSDASRLASPVPASPALGSQRTLLHPPSPGRFGGAARPGGWAPTREAPSTT